MKLSTALAAPILLALAVTAGVIRSRHFVQRLPTQWEFSPPRLLTDRLIAFDSPASSAHSAIKTGILDGDATATWRWTRQRAEFRLHPPSYKNPVIAMRFAIHERTLSDTGPVTVSLRVNGSLCKTFTYAKPGAYDMIARIRHDLISDDSPTLVTLEVSPPWISPEDGIDLGIILIRLEIKDEHDTPPPAP